MKVRISIVGRAAPPSMPAKLELPAGATVADALAALRTVGSDFHWSSSTIVAVSGRHAGTLASYAPLPLQENDELLLLSPVAGG
jgi:sulfur carrier protein ThiS